MEYEAGTLSPEQLNDEFLVVFEQTGGWKQIEERLAGQASGASDRAPITVEAGREGLDPATATIVVAIVGALAPAAQKVVGDLWTNVWLPRIKARKGDDAVGDPKEP